MHQARVAKVALPPSICLVLGNSSRYDKQRTRSTHEGCHEAGVAHVALECDALRDSARHNGGSSSAESPVEEEEVPAAVAACVRCCV